MSEGNPDVKLQMGDAVVDVTFNPGRKNDTRPDAGLTYGAHLRVDSTTGGAKLIVQTDFSGPVLLALLPEWSTALASVTLNELGFTRDGFHALEPNAWDVARDGVYAFCDPVQYAEPAPNELEFMAAFGFTPGARFNLALPMLRATVAEFTAASAQRVAEFAVVSAEAMAEAATMGAIGQPSPESIATAVEAQIVAEQASGAADGAAVVDADAVRQLNRDSNAAVGPKAPESIPPVNTETGERESKPRRRRQARPKADAVVVVAQTLGEPTEEMLAPVADVPQRDDFSGAPGDVQGAADDEADNPFAAFAAELG